MPPAGRPGQGGTSLRGLGGLLPTLLVGQRQACHVSAAVAEEGSPLRRWPGTAAGSERGPGMGTWRAAGTGLLSVLTPATGVAVRSAREAARRTARSQAFLTRHTRCPPTTYSPRCSPGSNWAPPGLLAADWPLQELVTVPSRPFAHAQAPLSSKVGGAAMGTSQGRPRMTVGPRRRRHFRAVRFRPAEEGVWPGAFGIRRGAAWPHLTNLRFGWDGDSACLCGGSGVPS